MVGAVLMDLAFANRIDTDTTSLWVVDRTPTGNPLFDSVLERVAGSATTEPASAWIKTLSEEQADRIRERALAGLVQRGILMIREEKKLWDLQFRRYSTIDDTAGRDAKLRLMNVLFSDQIPDPQDIALVCPTDVFGILRVVFEDREIERIAPRLKQIRMMDLIGREMIAELAVWKLGSNRPVDI